MPIAKKDSNIQCAVPQIHLCEFFLYLRTKTLSYLRHYVVPIQKLIIMKSNTLILRIQTKY